MNLRKFSTWLLGSLLVLFAALIAVGYFIDEPLRRYMEQKINASLEGYTVQIGRLDFHPIGFSVDLKDLVLRQDANPVPPIASIPKLTASVHWREILRGKIVSDWRIVRPTVLINLPEAEKEVKDDVPIEERGWQDAAKAIYPLKINKFQILDGDLTYIDKSPLKQIHIRNIYFQTENIANVESEKSVYPSPVYLEGILFDSGKITIDGNADFLAKPHLGMKSRFAFEQVNLNDLEPLIRRLNIAVRKGTLSGNGEVEFAPHSKIVHLERLTIDQIHADYIYHPQGAAPGKGAAGEKVKETAKETAKEASETESAPAILVQVDKIEVKNGNVGFVNKSADPDYRIFLEETDFLLTDFSNHLTEGKTEVALKAKFMGSGSLGAAATFRPEEKGPDLNVAVSIEETSLKTMNDLLRAYGNFDVTAGKFSFFMELAVKEGELNGYVKPLFKEVTVYDKRQDKKKGAFRKLYEGLVGGVAKIFENKRNDEVATTAELSGRIENPEASAWEIVVGLIQNAFFQAILPGFEAEVGRSSKK